MQKGGQGFRVAMAMAIDLFQSVIYSIEGSIKIGMFRSIFVLEMMWIRIQGFPWKNPNMQQE